MQLSEDAAALVRVVSLLGATIDPDELAIVIGKPAIELLGPLDEALKARVLEERNGSLVFRHDLVREAVYGDMPISVRKKLHRDAARALAKHEGPARRVAVHVGLAAEPGDEGAILWLRRAAADEMHTSPTLAADMLARALDISQNGDSASEEMQAGRVQALVLAGRVSEASELATDVLPGVRDTRLAADVRRSLGHAQFFQGRASDAGEQMERAADDVTGTDLGLFLSEAALAKLISGQLEPAMLLAARALTDGESTKDARALSLATAVRGADLLARGDGDALATVRRAVAIADEDFLSEAHRFGSLAVLGYALSENDLFDEAMVTVRRGMDLDQRQGVAWALPIHYGVLGLQHFLRGEWDDAVAELETLKGVHEDMDSALFGPLAHGLLANIAVHRNDIGRAEAEIEWGEEQVAERGPQIGAEFLMHARVLIAEAKGDLATALGLATAGCQLAQAMGLFLAFRYYGPTMTRLSVANGTPEGSRVAVEGADAYAISTGVPSAAGVALLCRGMLAGDAQILEGAVEVLATTPRPLELAMAQEQAGYAYAAQGEPQAAADHFQDAHTGYERLFARLDSARVAVALAEGGQRRKVRVSRPVTGWDSLSPTERRVAALVAEGLSNGAVADRLVVSRRTVETHVYHVFQKLGLSSRSELAARASRESAEVQ